MASRSLFANMSATEESRWEGPSSTAIDLPDCILSPYPQANGVTNTVVARETSIQAVDQKNYKSFLFKHPLFASRTGKRREDLNTVLRICWHFRSPIVKI